MEDDLAGEVVVYCPDRFPAFSLVCINSLDSSVFRVVCQLLKAN
jgi:hypothetical protein